MEQPPGGVHLTRTDENAAEIDGLAEQVGGRAGLVTLLGDLNRRARRTWAPGLAVRRALTWDAADRRDPHWWPQGISSSAEAAAASAAPDTDRVHGRRVLVVSWYSTVGEGTRVSFVDLDARRYRHVLLVRPGLVGGRPTVEPLGVHAGGLAWDGDHLHVAATGRGFHTCRLEDLLRLPEDSPLAAHGYRYLLPVRFSYRAAADDGVERLRYSFLSLDREASPPRLVIGEYGSPRQTRRLATFALDPDTRLLATGTDGAARPVVTEDGAAVRSQGVVAARGRIYLTASHGPWVPGSVHAGRPGDLRRHRWAAPMGPEDLTWWPGTDLLWSVSEHPRRRWIFAMPRARFDH